MPIPIAPVGHGIDRAGHTVLPRRHRCCRREPPGTRNQTERSGGPGGTPSATPSAVAWSRSCRRCDQGERPGRLRSPASYRCPNEKLLLLVLTCAIPREFGRRCIPPRGVAFARRTRQYDSLRRLASRALRRPLFVRGITQASTSSYRRAAPATPHQRLCSLFRSTASSVRNSPTRVRPSRANRKTT